MAKLVPWSGFLTHEEFYIGPSIEMLGHLKIFKIVYFLRPQARTIICLDNFNHPKKFLYRTLVDYTWAFLSFLHRFLTRSNPLGVPLILGVFGVICHYLRPLDKTILNKKKTSFCYMATNLLKLKNPTGSKFVAYFRNSTAWKNVIYEIIRYWNKRIKTITNCNYITNDFFNNMSVERKPFYWDDKVYGLH